MSKRINLIASYTSGYKTICDIGCDHALAIIKALKEYNCDYAYALDINKEPLERAKENVNRAGLSNKVSFFLSDGLKNCDISFDLAIISGMGGQLIHDILKDSWPKFKGKDLLLSPQSDNYLVRSFLANNGYIIANEDVVIDKNKYYELILAKPGSKQYDYLDLKLGPILRIKKDEIYLNQLNKLLKIKIDAYHKSKDIKLLEDIYLYKAGLSMNKINYYKENYYNLLLADDNKRDLIIIFPGGGYTHTSNREAENVALKYNALGYHAVVFHYRETLDTYETLYPSIIKVINELANREDVNKIYLNGFSAGGHLSLHLANHIKEYKLPNIEGIILCYPVVSTKKECIHEGSFKALLGDNLAIIDNYSEENNVNINSPKLFIWHAVADESVPVINTIYLVNAYQKLGLDYEAHLYKGGKHGMGLATKDSARDDSDIDMHIATWFSLASEWLKK